MDIEQLYQDFNIYYQTEGHKHCRPGWINTECPFCSGNPGLHLGAALGTTVFYCWRCGWKPPAKAIAKLCGVSEDRARELIREYGGRRTKPKQHEPKPLQKKPFKFPSGTGPLSDRHKEYLRQRGFDPDYLERQWGLMSTGPVSTLDKADYRHRILIPIYWNGRIASFQGRDVTGRSEIKYKACPKERERVHHQEIVYGLQSEWQGTGAVVEGVTDVWRLGTSAIATFGIEYTRSQVRILKKNFERMAVIFDDDPQAVRQADGLVAELRFRGVEAWRVTIKGDPADLSDDETNQLLKEVGV